jgi:putative transposase
MPHSFYKIWVHVIFSTKDREPSLKEQSAEIIYKYISEQLTEMGCIVRIINGMPDHIHLLFLQNPNKSISEIVKQIKGASSHFVNQEKLIKHPFAWQTGYGVFSVSESQIEKVFYYIQNQQEHHRKRTFEDEYNEFLKHHNVLKPSISEERG